LGSGSGAGEGAGTGSGVGAGASSDRIICLANLSVHEIALAARTTVKSEKTTITVTNETRIFFMIKSP
jgi:hypothetical protein